MREATPAAVPLATDLSPDANPAQPSLGRLVLKSELNTCRS